MIKRYPHTATLVYTTTGTYSTTGVYTPGTNTTVHIICTIQPNYYGNRYIVGKSGDRIGYAYHEYTVFCPLLSGINAVTDGACLRFHDRDHVILHLFNYQKHTEIRC